jgi:hypothetical protein
MNEIRLKCYKAVAYPVHYMKYNRVVMLYHCCKKVMYIDMMHSMCQFLLFGYVLT